MGYQIKTNIAEKLYPEPTQESTHLDLLSSSKQGTTTRISACESQLDLNIPRISRLYLGFLQITN